MTGLSLHDKAAIEDSEDSDSGGVEVASDRTLWRNLLSSANQLRERLSSEPKASCFLKAGCCDADPSFSHNLEVNRSLVKACHTVSVGGGCRAIGCWVHEPKEGVTFSYHLRAGFPVHNKIFYPDLNIVSLLPFFFRYKKNNYSNLLHGPEIINNNKTLV